VVVLGWFDTTSSITSVNDTKGNVYVLAIGPTSLSGAGSQAIFYAKNIASAPGGGNTVTVTFSAAVPYPDIRILEYSGIDTSSPVDVTAAAAGSSGTSASGVATTTTANDLILGANYVATGTSGPGSGFTRRILTSPDGDLVEDEIVSVASSYNATASLTSPGAWIMQMVAFRAAGSATPGPLLQAPK
jgi:hypothetical protein